MFGMIRNMLLQPFDTKGEPGTEAIVLAFDLEGFSKFFTQQDVHLHAPDYLNVVFQAVHDIFRSAKPYWIPENIKLDALRTAVCEPSFGKFMGDGGLYIWTAADLGDKFNDELKFSLLNMVWALKTRFGEVVKRAQRIVPLPELPSRIRFGITRGTVYGLRRAGVKRPVDYVGYSINLAARLQSYCREIGFIASARLGIPDRIETTGWTRTTAIALRGFGREYVYVDHDELKALDPAVRASLFE